LGLLLPGRSWHTGLIGAAVGYGVVRLIADGYYYLFKREGMGYGDGKLLAVIGALFGWQAILVSLFIGSIAGLVVCVPFLLLRSQKDSTSTVSTANDEEAPGQGQAAAGPVDSQEDEVAPEDPAAWRQVEVPFGPFIVIGALVYLYLEPWVVVSFSALAL
jgi:leader peptidase (prepilin peptidase)/N-methyltransferase